MVTPAALHMFGTFVHWNECMFLFFIHFLSRMLRRNIINRWLEGENSVRVLVCQNKHKRPYINYIPHEILFTCYFYLWFPLILILQRINDKTGFSYKSSQELHVEEIYTKNAFLVSIESQIKCRYYINTFATFPLRQMMNVWRI